MNIAPRDRAQHNASDNISFRKVRMFGSCYQHGGIFLSQKSQHTLQKVSTASNTGSVIGTAVPDPFLWGAMLCLFCPWFLFSGCVPTLFLCLMKNVGSFSHSPSLWTSCRGAELMLKTFGRTPHTESTFCK